MNDEATADELFALAGRAFAAPFSGVLRIEPEGEKAFFVDGRSAPPLALREFAEFDLESAGCCALRARRDALMRVLDGERQFTSAFVSGRLVVAGDISVLARVELGG
ncbi:MAG: SCP2 sterol-binding domain-containing protein [Parvularculaceae bacterium]|nr:SCP2 sterol-binding domain-containing protein [Parvularculaceae bacterium]